METYVPNRKVFEKLLSQSGGSIDRYIFGQKGEGLGNFFSKIFRFVKPLVGRAVTAIQPELASIGTKAIDSATGAVINKISQSGDKLKDRIKRKRDNLDV